ncbi:conjugal transfer protein TraB [Pararhizobium antarcticum]|uniref:Conjugal transfer protein TraB n=1 Tax=Pararhizobium antarcticum TaxID=1798805 RepID=A0A657LLZ8_9HYPH|nr:conjugal transfer protein TraB [Pararhizobium antarcticum]OJF91492.1 conjugal transfer protein TraB [Pararhizobium antarcticum]
MFRKIARPAVLMGLSAATGWIAWSGVALLLPVSLSFPILWSIAQSRKIAALVSAGYFLAASRGLPQGVAAFYQSDLWLGLFLWLCASLGFVVVHSILWTANARARPFRYLAAVMLMAVPPFGITGWAHPLTAAGALFPTWGWWGIAAMTAGLMGLVTLVWPAVAMALVSVWLWSAATWTDPILPDRWRGVDLHFGSSLGRETGFYRQRDLIQIVREAGSGSGRVVVLPESAVGNWTPTVERLWIHGFADTAVTVVAGATAVTEEGYDNVLVAISAQDGKVLYRQRMPVPGSMWQPWRSWLGQSGSARADFFANPVVELSGMRIAPLICYEQLIVWPVLQSMLHDPDVIVAVGNGWWTEGTSIVDIQLVCLKAWARLFAKPLVISFNT